MIKLFIILIFRNKEIFLPFLFFRFIKIVLILIRIMRII